MSVGTFLLSVRTEVKKKKHSDTNRSAVFTGVSDSFYALISLRYFRHRFSLQFSIFLFYYCKRRVTPSSGKCRTECFSTNLLQPFTLSELAKAASLEPQLICSEIKYGCDKQVTSPVAKWVSGVSNIFFFNVFSRVVFQRCLLPLGWTALSLFFCMFSLRGVWYPKGDLQSVVSVLKERPGPWKSDIVLTFYRH